MESELVYWRQVSGRRRTSAGASADALDSTLHFFGAG